MKILTTLLTSNDIPRLRRLVAAALEVRPVTGVDWEVVIVVNSIHEGYFEEVLAQEFPFTVVDSVSNGKCGGGKNACLDVFLDGDADYLSQIDGDDIVYPSYLQSLVNHINHYPCIDVLGVVPADSLFNHDNVDVGYNWWVNEKFYGSIWSSSMIVPNEPMGPQRGHLFTEEAPCTMDMILLRSRRSAEFRSNPDIGNGEDHVLSYQLLQEHQRGNLCYFLSMSSDLVCGDRTAEESAQSTNDYWHWLPIVREEALKFVDDIDRSSIWELPVVYQGLLMTHLEKQEWLNRFLNNEGKV